MEATDPSNPPAGPRGDSDLPADGGNAGRDGRRSRAALPSDLSERVFHLVTGGAAWFVLLILLAVTYSMASGGWLAFKTFGFGFVTSDKWDVVNGQFGALVPIYGTLVTSAIALVIAVPVSIGIALFLTEIAPSWSRQPVAMAIELLAAVPSIIYGMWGLFMFAPFMAKYVEPWVNEHLGNMAVIGPVFSGPPIGIGMLTAGIVLGIMVIPFIASVARDVFNAVPPSLARIRGGPRRDAVGAVTPRDLAAHPLGYRRRDLSRARTSAWGNHGGDLCARQRA